MNALGLPGWLRRSVCLAMAAGLAGIAALSIRADETDNYFLPLDTEFADFGDYLGGMHTWAIEEAVAELNVRIERALASNNTSARDRRLADAHEPHALAAAVARRFGDAFTETSRANGAFRGAWARNSHPDKSTSHANNTMNLMGRFPLDPRTLIMFFQARTIKAYGIYFGTDKLTHFHQVGWSYYKRYQRLRLEGLSEEEAYRRTIHYFAHTGVWAEDNMFGTLGTGVYSNADMAVNHVGFKFFINLTEPVTLKGKPREPLVTRTGVFWRLNHRVRPQSGWFADFVSDHWNEALNPNLYDVTMRSRIRRVLQKRADPIVRFYTTMDGRPYDPGYFELLARELSTYYGENYGHSGNFPKLLHLGNTCFPALAGESGQ